MKHINYFSDIGLDINITVEGNLKITGLSSLRNDLKKQVLQYAKENKQRIMFEMQIQKKTHQQQFDSLWEKVWVLADWIDDLNSNIPWQERAVKIPELQKMSLEIDRLKAKQSNEAISFECNPEFSKQQPRKKRIVLAPSVKKSIQSEVCPARCKQFDKCYGRAYFDGKPGRAESCLSQQCPWADQFEQSMISKKEK